jgi:hypothetical protein
MFTTKMCNTQGDQSSYCDILAFLSPECDAAESDGRLPTFVRNVLLPSLALKIEAVNLHKATRRHIKTVILQGLQSVRDPALSRRRLYRLLPFGIGRQSF